MQQLTNFTNLSPFQRMSQMKGWLVLLFIALVLAGYGIHSISGFYRNLDPLSKEIAGVTADLAVLAVQLRKVQRKITKATEQGDTSQELIEKEKSLSAEIEKLRLELERLQEECNRAGCQLGAEYPGLSFYILDFLVKPVYASESSQVERGTSQPVVDKTFILLIVMAVMGLVYLLTIFKVFFSSNPRNMATAIDAFKTITGFWIGIGTAAIGIT